VFVLVICMAWLQVVGQAKLDQIRPGWAGPKSRLDHGFGLALDFGKPKLVAQAMAFEQYILATREPSRNNFMK
jgi:hypothetical protein